MNLLFKISITYKQNSKFKQIDQFFLNLQRKFFQPNRPHVEDQHDPFVQFRNYDRFESFQQLNLIFKLHSSTDRIRKNINLYKISSHRLFNSCKA